MKRASIKGNLCVHDIILVTLKMHEEKTTENATEAAKR